MDLLEIRSIRDAEQRPLWRQCADWLTRCDIISAQHPIHAEDAEPVHLAQLLRDGVLLCVLAIKIDPQSIDTRCISSGSPMPKFLQLKNLITFLEACTQHFHLEIAHLFDPATFHDLTDVDQFVQTLSHLSHCPKMSQFSIPGFPLVDQVYSFDNDNYFNANELRSMANVDDIYDQVSDYLSSDNSFYWESDGSYLSVASHNPQFKLADNDPVVNRRPAIRELIDTEMKFVHSLEVVNEALQFMANNLSKVTREFADSVNAMYKLHSELYDNLLTSASVNQFLTWFLNWRHNLLIHGRYTFRIKSAQKEIVHLCKSSKIEVAIQDILIRKGFTQTGLADEMLLYPFQRLCRYPLLFQKLYDLTPQEHEDRSAILRTKQEVEDIIAFTNQAKKNSDDASFLAEIRDRVTGSDHNFDMELVGNFLFDDEVRVTSSLGVTKTQTLFLFTKRLIFCDSVKGVRPLKFASSLDLIQFRIQDCPPATLKKITTWTHRWQLLRRDSNSRHTLTLCAKTDALKVEWIQKFNLAFGLLEPADCRKDGHSFQLFSFANHSTCTICDKLLKGYYWQGYRCKHCNMAAHKECLRLCSTCVEPHPQLQSQPWYAGNMMREVACETLKKAPDGTFLLRYKIQEDQMDHHRLYAISLKMGHIRHLKILQKRDDRGRRLFYFRSDKVFENLEHLVEWHSKLPLQKYFPDLSADSWLRLPWKQVFKTAIVMSEYRDTLTNTLSIKVGQHIIIENKDGDQNGWWCGRYGDQIGQFPKEYVQEWTNDF